MDTRKFHIGSEEYQFNKQALKSRIEAKVKNEGTTREAIFNDLSESLGVSIDTARSWVHRANGPKDVKTVQGIAEILGITDYMFLLKKVEGGHQMKQLNDRQKDAAKRIYDKITWFLEEFNNTDGFTAWVFEYKDAGYRDPEGKTYDRIEKLLREVGLVIEQEYFDLHDEDIYDEFNEYFSEDIYETFNGKISNCCRFDAMNEDSPNHSTWEDYETAKRRLNEIIERYI